MLIYTMNEEIENIIDKEKQDYWDGTNYNFDGSDPEDLMKNQKEVAVIDDENISEHSTYSSAKIESIITTGGTPIIYEAGENIQINGRIISATDTKYNPATTGSTGLMTASDKIKLNAAITGYTETDPTVPAWAKEENKPTYSVNEISGLSDELSSKSDTGHTHEQYSLTGHTHTAAEVGALPDSTVIPSKTSDLDNDSGFITGYTETDPTVPAWAKEETKPAYTIEEISGLTEALAEKQGTITAGDSISLNGNTINVANWFLPIGSITMWATATPPSGWLLCNGQSITASTYSALSEVLNADVVPDLTGRFPLGANNSHVLNSSGGTESVELTIDEIPTHSHELKNLMHEAGTLSTTYRTFNLNSMGNLPTTVETLNPVQNTETTGGGQAHNNMPPYFTLNFIIKYK